MAHVSEYEVEDKFIDRLGSIGYQYVDLKNYDDVLVNCREQLAAFNAAKLKDAKDSASFSDAEWNRVLIHLDNHSVYESAKLLRDKYVLSLDKLMPEKCRTYEVCLEAVRHYGPELEYVPEELKTVEMCKAALEESFLAKYYVPEELKKELVKS